MHMHTCEKNENIPQLVLIKYMQKYLNICEQILV